MSLLTGRSPSDRRISIAARRLSGTLLITTSRSTFAPLVGITSRPGAEEHDARRLEPSNDAIHHDRNVRFRGHRVLLYRLQPSAWSAQHFSDCGLHGVTLRRFPLPLAEFISSRAILTVTGLATCLRKS